MNTHEYCQFPAKTRLFQKGMSPHQENNSLRSISVAWDYQYIENRHVFYDMCFHVDFYLLVFPVSINIFPIGFSLFPFIALATIPSWAGCSPP